MTKRISDATADEIARLLAIGGLSQGKIAAATGVSRSLVGQIRRGERGARKRAIQIRRRRVKEELVPPSGPLVWCQECGVKVQMPCVACRTRSWMANRRPNKS